MKLKTFEIFDPFLRAHELPHNIRLSKEQVKTIETTIDTATSCRKALADHFKRQGKPMDERAKHLDESLDIRERFLYGLLLNYDEARIARRIKQMELSAETFKNLEKQGVPNIDFNV